MILNLGLTSLKDALFLVYPITKWHLQGIFDYGLNTMVSGYLCPLEM